MSAPMRAVVPVLSAALLTLPLAAASAQVVFESPLAASAASNARRVLAGDLDGDGHLDLVTSRYQIFPDFGPPTLNFGFGDGSFGEPVLLGGAATVFRLADFDGDGVLDLLVGGGGTANNQAVAVKLGLGDGSFGPSLGISTHDSMQDPDDAAVADFDGDGALDVIVHRGIEPFLSGRMMLIFGNGDGSFDTPVIVVPFVGMDAAHHGRVQAGDVNGDGLTDIVYTTGHGSPVLLGQGGGAFAFGPCAGAGCGILAERDFVLADVDDDGRDDAITNQRVLLAQADGSFAPAQAFPAAFVPFAVAVGDLDGDGLDDVVLGRNGISAETGTASTLGDVAVLRGHGDGSFGAPGPIVSHVPQPRHLTLADIDEDGRLDVVAAEYQPAPGSLRVLLNRTYGAGSPFLDVGGALAGSNGFPIQLASGTLVAGQPFTFELANGVPGGIAFHVVGLSALNAAFKGGTLVPFPGLINGPFALDAEGGLALAGLWPAEGSGLTLWLQYWMPGGGGPAGFVASSGVCAQIP